MRAAGLVQGDGRQYMGERKGVWGTRLVAKGKTSLGKAPLGKALVLKAVSF